MSIFFPAARLLAHPAGRCLAGVVVLAVIAGDLFGQAAAEMRHGQIKCPPKTGYPLVFSPDGKLLAAGSRQSSTISIFDVAAAKETVRLQLPGDSYEYQLAFTADGRRLVSAGREDDLIRVWDVVTGKQVREFKKPMERCLALAPGGKRMALADRHRNTLKVFDVDTAKLIWSVDDGNERRFLPIEAVAFCSDGKTFALHEGLRSPGTASVQVVDVEKGTLIRGLQESNSKEGGVFRFLTISPDGKHLAAGGLMNRFGAPDRCLHVWDIPTGKQRMKMECKGEFSSFYWAAFSPDGSLMISSSNDGFVLFDLLNGKEICRLPEGAGGVFSPDGTLLAVPGQTLPEREGVITLYNMPQGRNEPLPRNLNGEQLETLWRDLAPDNDFRLQRVLASLHAGPDDTVTFVGKKLQPVAEAQRQRVKSLLIDLDDDEAKTREKAMAALQELAAAFEPLLADVSKNHESGEVRNRVRFILRRQRERAVPQSLLIHMRAVMVLEQIGTAQARQILTKIGGGPAGARLTEEAKQALERLAQAPRPK